MNEKRLTSLRTELLAAFALLAAAALLVAVIVTLLIFELVNSDRAAVYLALLVAADVLVFVMFAGFYLTRLVSRPLSDAVAAAEAIANGDLSRRMPQGATSELAALSASFNRMTDSLLEERAQLVHAEKLASVGRLAAGLAHEIGNPLGAINGYAHILRSKVRDDSAAQGKEAIDGLERESSRIDRIVRGLLDYARPRSPRGLVINAGEVVRSSMRLLDDQGALKRTKVNVDAKDAMVAAERFELEQVVVNLVLNAVDASGDGGTVDVRVGPVSRRSVLDTSPRRSTDPFQSATLSAEAPGRPRGDRWLESSNATDVIQIIVSDSGPGIPESERDRVFDPFYTTKSPGKGTGLGLAIVARIIDNLGGTVWVETAATGGAAFHILLPAAKLTT